MTKRATMGVDFRSTSDLDACPWEPTFWLRFYADKGGVCGDGAFGGALKVHLSHMSGCVHVDYDPSPYSVRLSQAVADLKVYSKVAAWDGADDAWWDKYETGRKVVSHYAAEAARLGYPVPPEEIIDAADRLTRALEAKRVATRRAA